MLQISVNKFLANLNSFIDKAINDHLILYINRKAGKDFIVMSAEDWEKERETLYVIQNSSLITQINESLKTHKINNDYKPTKDELNEINSF